MKMPWIIYTKLLVFLGILVSKNPILSVNNEPNNQNFCSYMIIGGGISGLHTAWKLSEKYPYHKICLLEKNKNRFGGRIKDINLLTKSSSMTDLTDDSPNLALGARRIMKGQKLMMNLAKELNITLEAGKGKNPRITEARGQVEQDGNLDNFVDRYTNLLKTELSSTNLSLNLTEGDIEYQLYSELLYGDEVKNNNLKKYKSLRNYIESRIGSVGFKFLHDMTTWKGDFQHDLSAESYISWLIEEFDLEGPMLYPLGGMSAFIRGLVKKCQKNDVYLFLGASVTKIDKNNQTQNFDVDVMKKRESLKFKAEKLILSIPPKALSKIGGNVISKITKTQQYRSIKTIPVFTLTNFYQNDAWFRLNSENGNIPADLFRAATSDHCLASLEIPQEPSLSLNDDVNIRSVFRPVYCDKPECVKFFSYLAFGAKKTKPDKHYANSKNSARRDLQKIVSNGLKLFFNSSTIEDPLNQPINSKPQLWEEAWSWLKAGSKFSNDDIARWALNPIGDNEDENLNGNLALACDHYYPQRSVWSEAGIISSRRALRKFGLDIPFDGYDRDLGENGQEDMFLRKAVYGEHSTFISDGFHK